MIYAVAGGLTACLGALYTLFVRRLALQQRILDDPRHEPERRIHRIPVPLLGGLAIWLAITTAIVLFVSFGQALTAHYIAPKFLIGVVLGGGILMIGGYFDDTRSRSIGWKILFPFLASMAIVASGIGVNFITNPFGGVWRIDAWQLELLTVAGVPYFLTVWADLFTVAWLMSTMFTTKVLDGLDGLVTGITVLGATVIFILSMLPPVLQPDTALLAAIIAGGFLGFLPFNWFPAKIFLGEGGSLLAGYSLGVLAIIAGGKMATTLLLLGLPLLDLAWVTLRRVAIERRSPFTADRLHLHFRLLEAGLTVPQSVLLLYGMVLFFGATALFLQSAGKFYALLILAVVASLAIIGTWIHQYRKLS